MKQNTPAEEVKSQVDKQPPSKPVSAAEIPLWLVTSLVLGFASLVSLVYYFFARRKRAAVFPTQPHEPQQAGEPVPSGLDIIKSNPAFAAGVENSAQQKSADEEFKSSEGGLTWEKVKPALGPLLALMVAYFAQGVFDSTTGTGLLRNWEWLVFLTETTRQWLGTGIYLIAVLIWFFSAPAMPFTASLVNPSRSQDDWQSRPSSFRIYALVTGIVVYVISLLSFLRNGENGFVRAMWGFGLVCFILSQLPTKVSHPQAEESPRFRWQNWLVLALILLVGCWLRFYLVAVIPDDLHGDMASHGWIARDFLLGTKQDIFGFGWTATPTIGFLPAFLTMAVFGDNIFGMQMAAVIGGVFSLFAIYLLTWRLFNSHRLAALTTALVAINVVHIHFSRIFNMEPWPFSNFAIFLLIDGLKSRRTTSFGLAGVLMGFSMLMYTSGRALPFIILIFFVYAFFFQRRWVTQNLWGFVLLAVGFLVAMGPALAFYLKELDSFLSRSREVYLFSEGVMAHLLNKYNTDSPLVVLLTQIKLSLLMFHQSGDTSTQFGYPYPMFNSLVSPLILLGLGFAIRRWKEAGMAFVLIWLAVITVLGSILTIDAPFWPRLVGILPAAALLIAVALEQLLELGRKIFGTQRSRLIVAFMAVFLAIVGYVTWNQYYLFVKDSGSPSTLTGRYIGLLPSDVTACGITNPQLAVRETSFLAWPHKLVDIAPDAPDSELDNCTGTSIVWAISPENIGRLDAIRARWPQGILDEQYNPRRNYTMTFYLVGVQPPEFESREAFDLFPSFFKLFGVLIPFVLAGMLVWFFFQSAILKFWHEFRSEKKPALPLAPRRDQLPRQPAKPGSAQSVFTGWYTDLTSFKFPAVTPKLIVSIVLPFLAVGLAYFAQTFLDQSLAIGSYLGIESLYYESVATRQWIAVLIFFAAALLWTFATAAGSTTSSQGESWQGQSLQPAMGSPIQIAGFFFALSAILLYAINGETALTRWLWLAGLLLFLASLFIKNQSNAQTSRDESPSFRWFHTLTLLLMLVVAFAMRVYRLYDIPLDLSTDMASVGINARDYLLGVEDRIFGTGWYYYPRLVFLPYTVSMWLTGNNLFGLNFGTAVLGTLNLLGIYLFIWRLFDRHRLALLTAVLVAINPAHIEFSRIPSYVDPWALGFFGLFFFVDGLKGQRWASMALAGLFTGLTLVSYPSGRAIIPILAVGLISVWLFKRKWVTDNYGGFVWMFLGGLVALGPNLVYFITDWSVYMKRSSEVIIFDPGVVEHLKATYEVDSIWMIIWEQTKRSVLQFNYYADRSAQFFYPYPMFNSLVSPLLLLGFGMSLHRWRKPEFLISISSFTIILVMGSILTNDAPTWVRLVGIIPFAALLIALVMDELLCLLERLSLKPFVPLLALGIVLLVGRLAVGDWNAYIDYAGNEDIVRPEIHVGRYLDTLPDDISACGITYQHDYLVSQEEIQFLGWPRSIVVVPVETAVLTPDLCPGEKVVWILSPVYEDRLAEIQAMSPGGVVKQHLTDNGWHVFTSYMVSAPPAP